MGEALDQSALEHWQQQPTDFIEQVLRDPETGRAFRLLPCERRFLEHAYKRNDQGRFIFPEQVYATPKKTGKTTFSAMHLLLTTLVYGGPFAEGYCLANDLEQARGRVFEACRRIVEASPYLVREANVTNRAIEFPAIGATITAIASDYAGAAGANPTISAFDELWAFTSERSQRLWDEMVPVPTRKISCRLVTTYAGFEGESELLEELYKRGLGLHTVGLDLHAGDGLLMFWTHEPQAPWQTQEWIEQMRSQLRPNAFLRMIENRFVTSEETFVEMQWWDACTTGRQVPADASMPVWVGVDASVKHDSTGIAVCTWDKAVKKVRLVSHRIFQPSPDDPIDFENTIEDAVLGVKARYRLREVRYDPMQMVSTAQRLTRQGVKMVEFPQSPGNITAASQNLYELIQGGGLVAYPDEQVRLAVQRAVALETSRGWKITKEKSSHKVDVVVALGMAALAAVQQGERPEMRIGTYNPVASAGDDGSIHWDEEPEPPRIRIETITEKEDLRRRGLL